MKQLTRPLFQVDPGWLFVLAGLVICAAGIILPAQGDLDALQQQLGQLRAEEVHAYARLKAHSDFMDQVDRADPALVRRLAAAQLNLVPQGDKPVLLAVSDNSPVTDWIDGTVKTDIRPSKPVAISTLSHLANGPYRLWMFGGGIMSVFVGLMLSPAPLRMRAKKSRELFQELLADGGIAVEPKLNELSIEVPNDEPFDGQALQTIIEPKHVDEIPLEDSIAIIEPNSTVESLIDEPVNDDVVDIADWNVESNQGLHDPDVAQAPATQDAADATVSTVFASHETTDTPSEPLLNDALPIDSENKADQLVSDEAIDSRSDRESD